LTMVEVVKENQDQASLFQTVTINIIGVAFLAALTEQVFHETCHGIAALVVGARWDALNLFAASTSWNGNENNWGNAIISGNAALMNIFSAIICVAIFNRGFLLKHPYLRLFVLYFTAYSLFAGFGYLMTDPIFYKPGTNIADWKKVVEFLGGGWGVRLPIIAIGAAGVLWGYFWLPKSVLKFSLKAAEQSDRLKFLFRLLVVPYI